MNVRFHSQHNCPTCGGPACAECGNRLTIINDHPNCRACIERSLVDLGEYMRQRNA